MQFETINPEDEGFDDVLNSLEETGERFDYNGFATYYNEMKVGALTHWEFPKEKLSSLRKQLERRGLILGGDVTAVCTALQGPVEMEDDNETPKLDANGDQIPLKDEKGVVIEGPMHVWVRRLTDKKAEIIKIKQSGRKPKGTAEATTTATAAGSSDAAPAAPATKPADAAKAGSGKAGAGKGKGK